MKINQLRKGILISKRAENKNADRIYFELSRWSIGQKNIKLYPNIVFGFLPSGRYLGATHYETPYTYSLDEFEKRFYPTGIATTRRIRKLFSNSGCRVDYMSPIQKAAYSKTTLEENEGKGIEELREENEFLRCCMFAAEKEKEDLEVEMLCEAAERERREYLDQTHGKYSGYGPDSFMCYMSDYD